ncbi:unnamed protein product [Spirodela intermedia]|uniref:Uncharacterized protein n=1 Tax=Spirodela intermedia TaxID=51605 RepID=A0A7I8KNV1_SPIIN|nr:unnamed protein product [Spirodela intermedia]
MFHYNVTQWDILVYWPTKKSLESKCSTIFLLKSIFLLLV